MSAPARAIPQRPRPAPARRTQPRRAQPRRTGVGTASRRRPVPRRRRLAVALPFLVGALLFAAVALQVFAAQTSLDIDAANDRIERLADEQRELLRQQATLSAPGRIAEWASAHGMELATGVRILTAPVGG